MASPPEPVGEALARPVDADVMPEGLGLLLEATGAEQAGVQLDDAGEPPLLHRGEVPGGLEQEIAGALNEVAGFALKPTHLRPADLIDPDDPCHGSQGEGPEAVAESAASREAARDAL